MTPLELLEERLQARGARGRGRDWQCPAHEDAHASLSIGEGDDGRALVKCHGGCPTEAIVAALGLTLADLFPGREERHATGGVPPWERPIRATFDYRNALGELLFQVVRFDDERGEKCRPRFPDPTARDGWTWKARKTERPLYRLPELLDALEEGEVILIPEGEKDVETLRAHGFSATTNPGGAEGWRQSYAPTLRGANVVILPDNDEPGRKHAKVVARSLVGVAARIRVIELPSLPPKGDVSDWFEAGGTAESLKDLARSTPEWAPTEEPAERPDSTRGREKEGHGAQGGFAPWPQRRELPALADPVPTLDPGHLPGAFRAWLADTAERMAVPLEFVAAPALVATGAVIGRSVSIRPMALDDWRETPNLWGAIVGPPGVMKTAALSEALRPLSKLAVEARRAHEAATAERDALAETLKARREALRAEMKKAAQKKNGDDLSALRDRMRDLQAEEAAGEVHERRFMTQDATIEKLGELLNQNPRGLLILRDELTGWLKGLDRDDRAQDRAFFLESWNGTGRFTVDRIGRGTLHVEAVCLSVLGGIQPGRLRPYLLGAIGQGEEADGLLPRLQVTVWPDDFGEWRNVDRWPDSIARRRAGLVFERLAEFVPAEMGAEEDEFSDVPFFRFCRDAQGLFLEWRTDLERRLRSRDLAEFPAFVQHLAKYRKLVPALALILHVAETTAGAPAGPVSLDALKLALTWAEFLEAHARKLYAPELKRGASAACALAERIELGSVSDGMTVRDLSRREWSGLKREGAVYEAVSELSRFGWARLETIPSGERGGRPSEVIRLHPELRSAECAA